jgi:predicted Co/Zn/Cd cation transporter (cation efflux family)
MEINVIFVVIFAAVLLVCLIMGLLPVSHKIVFREKEIIPSLSPFILVFSKKIFGLFASQNSDIRFTEAQANQEVALSVIKRILQEGPRYE